MELTGESSSAIVPSKRSANWMVWGGMTGRGLTSSHFIPQKSLRKKRSLFRSTTEEPVKQKLFTNKSSATFVQDGAPARTAKATQQWCKKNLPNFIQSGQKIHLILTPLKTYGTLLTMEGLKLRLRQAWQNIPQANLRELQRSFHACNGSKTLYRTMGGGQSGY